MGKEWYLVIGSKRKIGTGRGDQYRFFYLENSLKKFYLLCYNVEVVGYRTDFVKSVKGKECLLL